MDDDPHRPHPKPMQPDAVAPAEDRTEIADHLKDALWADACTAGEYADQLAGLAGHDPAEVAAHDQAMRSQGLRA